MASPSLAAEKYIIDPEHVWVEFSIRQYVYAWDIGTFKSINGEIVFDKQNVPASSVRAEISTESVSTGDGGRDSEIMYSFLDGKAYPKITFVSTSVEKTGDASGKIIGDLSIGGVTVPVTLITIFDGEAPSMFTGRSTAGFSATGTLNTDDFKIPGLKVLKILPEVKFIIEVDAIKE